ncbi:MAG: hypothetical protein KAH99_05190, partial [Verrucomicrobia bacterium]|nr:hypothetical protein [Verrucomicrobiota bacterium]
MVEIAVALLEGQEIILFLKDLDPALEVGQINSINQDAVEFLNEKSTGGRRGHAYKPAFGNLLFIDHHAAHFANDGIEEL